MLKKEKSFDKKNFICICIILLVTLVPRLVLCMQAYPLRTRMDEAASMAGAAYFAGLDWSAMIKNASYYGTGFTGLFSFFFRITDNPIIIYRCYLVVCTILQSSVGLICFCTMRKFFHVKNKVVLALCSIASSYMVVTRAMVVYNEHMLIILMWLIVYLLLYINSTDDKKKRLIGTLALTCALGYSIMVHARAITFVIMLIVLIVFAYLYKKVKVVNIPVFAIMCSLGVFAAQYYVKWVQNAVWAPGAGEVLPNSAISLEGKIELLRDLDSWKAIALTILGQTNTISMLTAGAAIVILCATIRLIFGGCGRKKKKDKALNLILIVLVYSIGCIAITIVGQSITWIESVLEVIETGYECDMYGIKAFTYVRYFGPYCGPLIMMFGILLDKFAGVLRRSVLPAILLMAGNQAVWLRGIVPYMVNLSTDRGSIEALLCFAGAEKSSVFDYAFFCKVSLVAMVVVTVVMLLIKYNRKALVLSFLSLFLIYQYIYNAIVWDINANQAINYSLTDSGYYVISQLEERSGIGLPDKLFVVDEEKYVYQHLFMFNRYQVICGLPEQDEEHKTAIVFSRFRVKEGLEEYQEFQLDDNEFMYIKGDALHKAVKEILAENKSN